jgi:Trypsin-like peptidase domain
MAATGIFLTSCITRLDLFTNDIELGKATGFFYHFQGSWFIITNWHVFSGRDPRTGQPRHASGAIPNKFRFYTTELTEQGIAWRGIDYNLEYDGKPTWLQHPIAGQSVDLAAIKIDSCHKGMARDLLAPDGHDSDMFMDLGAEVFLPGYPLGISCSGIMPIWKRGSIASSLEFGEGVTTKFFVDTATREGMSGSPCLALCNWKYYRLDRQTGKMSIVDRPLSWRLLGVYSGRINPSNSFEAQIGIVWRDILIPEVVRGEARGSYQLLV